MGTQRYFEQALANFTFEAACGGAIRHLADKGYTVRQILERLDFPANYEQVQNAVFEHFCASGVLLLKAPEYAEVETKPEFIREYDAYGKPSFRRVTPRVDRPKISFQELPFSSANPDTLLSMIGERLHANGADASYISCDFGLWDSLRLETLKVLNTHQQEYIAGIPWPKARIYHQLNQQMKAITTALYRSMSFPGCCYFLKTQEKIIFK